MKVTKTDYNNFKTYLKAGIKRLDLEHNIDFSTLIKLLGNNPKIKNPFIAACWEVFYLARIPRDMKKDYNDNHLETAIIKAIKELIEEKKTIEEF